MSNQIINHGGNKSTLGFYNEKDYWNENTLCFDMGRAGFDLDRIDYYKLANCNRTFERALYRMALSVNQRNEIRIIQVGKRKRNAQTKEELYTVAGIGKDSATRKKFNEWLDEKLVVLAKKVPCKGGYITYFYFNPVYYKKTTKLYIWTYDLFRDFLISNPFHRLTDFQFRVLEKHLQKEKHARDFCISTNISPV